MTSFESVRTLYVSHYKEWIKAGCPKNLTVTRIFISYNKEITSIPTEIGNLHKKSSGRKRDCKLT